jgi:anti-sigma regulatory factor (Ser/Thr protein kinase)
VTAGGVYEIAAAPSAPRAAREAADTCCDGLSAGAKHTVRLLVTELVSNGVRHAGATGDPIVVRFAVGARSVRVAVTDRGPGFEPRTGHPGPDAESGYGLFLVDRMADRWGASNDGAMTVWFELHRGRAEPLKPDRVALVAGRAGRRLALLWVRSAARALGRAVGTPSRPEPNANVFSSSRQARVAPRGWRPPPERGSRFPSPRKPDRTE